MSSLTQIRVEHFKSLKDFQITLGGFTVLIGPNGSGKTNVLELFKFANLCLDPPAVPADPFGSWSGFENIVWMRDHHLHIRLWVQHAVGGHDVRYAASISGADGQAAYVGENLTISRYLSVARQRMSVTFELDHEFLEQISRHGTNPTHPEKPLDGYLRQSWKNTIALHESIVSVMQRYPALHASGNYRYARSLTPSPLKNSRQCDVGFFHAHSEDPDGMVLVPSIRIQDGEGEAFLHDNAVNIFAGGHPLVLLRQLNYAGMRRAPSLKPCTALNEDGTGLINILFQWHNSHDGLPDSFGLAMRSLFPGWQISFTLTGDGRILLNVHDGTTLLHPPSIPDGFYKLLVILAAVELRPKFLLIDEIETSLHAKMIEYIISELRNCESSVVITTHSPAVIDAVHLEDLVLLERGNDGTKCRRIDNPDNMRQKLNKLGVTVSEGWLYGRI